MCYLTVVLNCTLIYFEKLLELIRCKLKILFLCIVIFIYFLFSIFAFVHYFLRLFQKQQWHRSGVFIVNFEHI